MKINWKYSISILIMLVFNYATMFFLIMIQYEIDNCQYLIIPLHILMNFEVVKYTSKKGLSFKTTGIIVFLYVFLIRALECSLFQSITGALCCADAYGVILQDIRGEGDDYLYLWSVFVYPILETIGFYLSYLIFEKLLKKRNMKYLNSILIMLVFNYATFFFLKITQYQVESSPYEFGNFLYLTIPLHILMNFAVVKYTSKKGLSLKKTGIIVFLYVFLIRALEYFLFPSTTGALWCVDAYGVILQDIRGEGNEYIYLWSVFVYPILETIGFYLSYLIFEKLLIKRNRKS